MGKLRVWSAPNRCKGLEKLLLFFLLIKTLGYSDADQMSRGDSTTTVLATDGGRAVIPCLAKLRADNNDSAVLVRWFRGNQSEPFYSLDSRSRRGGLSKGHHSRDNAWKGRSFFSVIQEPPSLKINRVDYDDRGAYVCDLLYASGRRYSAVVFLAVFVPPTEFAIKNIDGALVRDTIGPLTEGEDLILICEVLGGKPMFQTTWQNNMGAAVNVTSILEGDMQRTFLRIEPLKRQHWGLNVTCIASILDGLFTKSVSAHILLHRKWSFPFSSPHSCRRVYLTHTGANGNFL